MRHLSLLALLLATPSAALADQTISQLEATAQAIQSQLQLSNTLSLGATYYATTGGVIEAGALDTAQITQQMMDDYNAAIDAVVNSTYATAQTIFMDAHNAAMSNLNTSVDQLVSATTVLSSVGAVAEMAATADTTQEQVALQNVLVSDPGLQVTQVEVDNFNQSLDAVGSYAREAGAFLAAANNSSLTSAVDSFAASNNVAVGAYTAITFHQTIDQYIITWGDSGFAAGWSGYNTDNMIGAQDLYGMGQYISGGNS
jgi:hypothetical protein